MEAGLTGQAVQSGFEFGYSCVTTLSNVINDTLFSTFY